jgi:hypothetical protein
MAFPVLHQGDTWSKEGVVTSPVSVTGKSSHGPIPLSLKGKGECTHPKKHEAVSRHVLLDPVD